MYTKKILEHWNKSCKPLITKQKSCSKPPNILEQKNTNWNKNPLTPSKKEFIVYIVDLAVKKIPNFTNYRSVTSRNTFHTTSIPR